MKHKLQAAVPVLCWCFFNLNEIMIVGEKNISSFLIAKLYEINFYQQRLATVGSTTKWEQLKGIPDNRYCPTIRAKCKIFRIYFPVFYLYFKSTFLIFKRFMNGL